MTIDPKDYHELRGDDGELQFRYVTDQQVLDAHGREKFTVFQKYMQGQTCPVISHPIEPAVNEVFAACYVWDYEKWVGHNCPVRDRSSSWD